MKMPFSPAMSAPRPSGRHAIWLNPAIKPSPAISGRSRSVILPMKMPFSPAMSAPRPSGRHAI
ncbi:hypothetical protein CKQ90_35335, partial [Klebsiella pneumoniae]